MVERAQRLRPAPQAAIAARRLVEAVGIGEASLRPEQQAEAVLNGALDHRRVLEPRQVDVAGEVLGELLDGDVVAAPKRDASSSMRSRVPASAGDQQLLAAQSLARTRRQRVLPRQPIGLP